MRESKLKIQSRHIYNFKFEPTLKSIGLKKTALFAVNSGKERFTAKIPPFGNMNQSNGCSRDFFSAFAGNVSTLQGYDIHLTEYKINLVKSAYTY